MLEVELLEDRLQHVSGDVRRFARWLWVAVHQHLGLDDGDQSGFLRERREAGQLDGVGVDARLGRRARPDGVDGAPLGEASAQLAVLRQPIAQPVQALGTFSPGAPARALAPLSTLMPGMIPRPPAD